MPRAAKACSDPHCPRTQPCELHQPKPWQGSTRSKRLPSNWRRLRKRVLYRDPVCRICDKALSREVDHITPGDDHSLANLQGVCVPCHRAKTQAEATAARASLRH